jgi:hypothetical protein
MLIYGPGRPQIYGALTLEWRHLHGDSRSGTDFVKRFADGIRKREDNGVIFNFC